MAFEQIMQSITLLGDTTPLVAHTCCVTNSAGEAAVPSGAVAIIGVTLEDGTAAVAQGVAVAGIVKCRATAAALAIGDEVMTDSAGRVLALSGVGAISIGVCMSATGGAADEVVSVLLRHGVTLGT